MTLRDYQQDSVEAAMAHVRKSLLPALIVAPTGAGKSHIVAALAKELHAISHGKAVLCLAPSKELVIQNASKYEATGNPCSLYSASVGRKCLAHPVVFGSPKSVLNRIDDFLGRFCAVVIDEAHGLTPTIREIVERLRADNPQLRVIGLTATPYRLGEGYIYRQIDGRAHGPEKAHEPYFDRCVQEIDARHLLERGYLTPPTIGATGEHYDTSGLKLNRMRRYDAADVDAAFVGHGRLTASIMGEVVAKSRDRQGVLIFAATIAHAEECLASLPPGLSAIVTGGTPPKERAELLDKFLKRKLKYLVNVAVLTTGFDAPHVDTIAILRKTESVGLLQQIVGRGLRVSPGKTDCLILDYAENIETHCPDGDIFDPEIKARPAPGESPKVEAECPTCGTVNEFSAAKDAEGYKHDKHGYCIDLTGRRIETEYGPMPAHHGRRCEYRNNRGERCSYRWTAKKCPACGEDNDISARRCATCKAELVDPNQKLAAEFRAFKRDPTRKQTDRILDVQKHEFTSKAGNRCLKVRFFTDYRQFMTYYQLDARNRWAARKLDEFSRAFANGRQPKTVTYRKNPKSGFFDVLGYDNPPDSPP